MLRFLNPSSWTALSAYRKASRRRILFYRNFRQFTGGHLKVWDYFSHTLQSQCFLPEIFFSADTRWNPNNPWNSFRDQVLTVWQPEKADALFLAGLDWLMLPETQRNHWQNPIINLIQHVRHADPSDERYPFLRHRAIRVCVSEEVADTLRETRQLNGPLFVIPNGIDLKVLPRQMHHRDIIILIAGLKQPELGRRLEQTLRNIGHHVVLLAEALPRSAFLEYLARAHITVFLPNPREGFYLPALEGMALGCLVICPDCVGNRSFCISGYNCLRPSYTEEALLSAVYSALRLCDAERDVLLANAVKATAAKHGLEREREAYLDILNNINQLW